MEYPGHIKLENLHVVLMRGLMNTWRTLGKLEKIEKTLISISIGLITMEERDHVPV